MNKTCSICQIFQTEGWEIENTPDEPNPDKFPEELYSLTVIHTNAGLSNDTIFECSKCKALYCRHGSVPGGSLDAMKTCYVERLMPISKEEVEKLITQKNQQEMKQTVYVQRYNACKSPQVYQVSSGAIGGEVFINMKCDNCGKEDTLDEYQLEDWYS